LEGSLSAEIDVDFAPWVSSSSSRKSLSPHRGVSGGGSDRFRIKIWDRNDNGRVAYDNQRGAGYTADAATTLGGGIVIHEKW